MAFAPALFAFDHSKLYEALQFKDPITGLYCPEIENLDSPILSLSLEQLKTLFLKSLLAEGKLEWLSFSLVRKTLTPPTDFVKRFDFTFRESLAGATLIAELEGNELVKGEKPRLAVQGEFVFYKGRSLQTFWASKDIWALGLRVTQLQWSNQKLNLLPWILIGKKGLTIPIIPISLRNESQRPLRIEPDLNNDNKTIIIKGIEAKSICGSAYTANN
jgi:hypothetical protein